jgi:hypothetical protein
MDTKTDWLTVGRNVTLTSSILGEESDVESWRALLTSEDSDVIMVGWHVQWGRLAQRSEDGDWSLKPLIRDVVIISTVSGRKDGDCVGLLGS